MKGLQHASRLVTGRCAGGSGRLRKKYASVEAYRRDIRRTTTAHENFHDLPTRTCTGRYWTWDSCQLCSPGARARWLYGSAHRSASFCENESPSGPYSLPICWFNPQNNTTRRTVILKKAKRVWTLGLATASILLANSASGDAGFTAAVVGIGATLYTEKYLGYDSDVGASDYFMIKEGSDCELQGSTNNSCTTHCPKGLKELAYKFSEPGKTTNKSRKETYFPST